MKVKVELLKIGYGYDAIAWKVGQSNVMLEASDLIICWEFLVLFEEIEPMFADV